MEYTFVITIWKRTRGRMSGGERWGATIDASRISAAPGGGARTPLIGAPSRFDRMT